MQTFHYLYITQVIFKGDRQLPFKNSKLQKTITSIVFLHASV